MSAATSVLPMGCARCGVIRILHDAPDHGWQNPSMRTVLARAAAIKQRRAA